MSFLNALLITLAIETAIVYALLRGQYPLWQIVVCSCLASMITLPFVWFVFSPMGVLVIWSELFAVVVEAAFYRTVFKNMEWDRATKMSLVANFASFTAGILISMTTHNII